MKRALASFTVPYRAAVFLKNLAYDRGWFRARELGWPVVSIGNLSVGGAGKTPFVQELAGLLGARGLRVDVLSRGYGRRGGQPFERVRVDGTAARYGDEPLLLARATGVPVYVGASRWASGRLAESEAGAGRPGIHLLDDGFQHRKLARAADIVLLHPADFDDGLLPAGRLREGLGALRRADFVVLREDDFRSEAVLRKMGIDAPVWRVRRSLAVPSIKGDAVAFCGIAHPEEFFAALRAGGVELRKTFAFRDHHRFRARELRAIAQETTGAAALLTTEKDWARLGEDAREILAAAAPLCAVPLRAELLEASRCVAALLETVAQRRPAAMRE